MINKEEIRFNSKSLVSTWLNDTKDFSNLRLVFSNNNREMVVPCTEYNCGDFLADALIKHSSLYTKVSLLGTHEKINKVFGTLDIN